MLTSFGRVVGLSISRQVYIHRLERVSDDKSLSSTLVVVLIEIEATYALASCTIATSRNFMDNFNTGFGVGHIRGAAEGYNLSDLGGSTSRTKRTVETGTMSSVRAGNLDEVGCGLEKRVTMQRVLDDGPPGDYDLVLRPNQTIRCQAYVKSNRQRFSDNGSISGDSDEMHIVRHTEYMVSHDEAPILPKETATRS